MENLLRRAGSRDVSQDDVRALAQWPAPADGARVAFMPHRVLMQDFTGVPATVDLAAMRTYDSQFLFSARVDPGSLRYQPAFGNWSIGALVLK